MSGKYAGMPSKADIAAFWCSEVSLAECRDRTGWFTELQTEIAANGIEGLLAKSKQVVVIEDPGVCCRVCSGDLRKDDWGEYMCSATPECEKYTYMLQSEIDWNG